MEYEFKRESVNLKNLRKFKPSSLKFPINFWTVEGGEFLGDLLTDGSYHNDGCVVYSNSELENILSNLRSTNKLFSGKMMDAKRIMRELSNLQPQEIVRKLNKITKGCGIYSRVRFKEREKVFEVSYSRILKVFLDKLKIPRGKRTLTNPELPPVLKEAPLEVISSFLRRVISNEATITKDGQICIKQSILSSHKTPKLLEGYRELFKKFGVKTTKPRIAKKVKRKDGIHVIWEIYTRPYDLKKIIERIGIEPKRKRMKAEKFLKNAERFRLSRNERMEQIIKIAKSLGKPFTVKDLMKSMDLKRTAIQDYLHRLMKKGLVCRNKKRKFYPFGSEPFFYQLTKKGEKLENQSNSF